MPKYFIVMTFSIAFLSKIMGVDECKFLHVFWFSSLISLGVVLVDNEITFVENPFTSSKKKQQNVLLLKDISMENRKWLQEELFWFINWKLWWRSLSFSLFHLFIYISFEAPLNINVARLFKCLINFMHILA